MTFPTNPIDDEADDPEIEDWQADETPVFINPADAIEVPVNDDDIPMSDDDDDDGGGAGNFVGADDAHDENEVTDETDMIDAEPDDTATLKLSCHTGPVYAVASFYDGQKLIAVSGGGDDRAYLHEVYPTTLISSSSPSTNTTKLLDYPHTDSVSCTALNLEFVSEDRTKNPRWVATAGYDGAIVLYDADSGQNAMKLEGPTDVEWLRFHPLGGTVLLAGSAADGTVWMYHLPLKKCLQVFVGHDSAVTDGNFTPDGRFALSCSADGTLRIWAPKTGVCRHVFRFDAGLNCLGISGGSDNQLVIVGSEDGQAHVCHTGTKKVVASLRHYEHSHEFSTDDPDDAPELPTSVEAVAFCRSNPNWCATGGVDGVLKVWDLANHAQCRHTCRTDEVGGITRLEWHPNLALVVCCYTHGAVRVWDARNGRLLDTARGSRDVINDMSVQYLNDGRTITVLTGSDDNIVRLFEMNVESLLTQRV